MDGITIRLIKVNGFYVAADVSSAWNLASLGIGDIKADRNQAGLKKLRRAWKGEFDFTVVRATQPNMTPTLAEKDALGNVAGIFANAA